jgi:hypothetical protein
MLTIEARALGKKQPLVPDWSVPPPSDLPPEGAPLALAALIDRIVRDEVAAFRHRQEERRLTRVLSPVQNTDRAARGKVTMGGSDLNLNQSVDEDAAVETALQAFEDGIYMVILDGEQQRRLETEVFLKPDSRITFLRLVMLAGG